MDNTVHVLIISFEYIFNNNILNITINISFQNKFMNNIKNFNIHLQYLLLVVSHDIGVYTIDVYIYIKNGSHLFFSI